MFSNSGKAPLSLVFQTLMNVKNPEKRRYSDILLNANTRFAINYISKVLKSGSDSMGDTLDGFTSNERKSHWMSEEPFIKISISAPITRFRAM
jgi:hypothetical protein